MATERDEPYVAVISMDVDPTNINAGAFELDWNEYFIIKLRQEGYGADGDPDEEIVDRWFRELCANVVTDGDYGGPIDTGMLDVQNLKAQNKL